MFPQPSTNYRYTFYYNYDECSTFNLYNFDTSFKTDKYSYGLGLLVSLFVLTLSKISFVRTACHFLDIKLLVQCYLRHHKCSSSTTIGLLVSVLATYHHTVQTIRLWHGHQTLGSYLCTEFEWYMHSYWKCLFSLLKKMFYLYLCAT